MITRIMILAISEYYNIPLRIAKLRFENRISDNQYEDIYEWYLNKIEEVK